MAMKTPKTGGPNIAQGMPVIRRLLDSMEDGEEVDFTAWTDETRVANMDEQLKCCVIGEAAVEEKIKGYCARSGMAISVTLKKKLGELMHFSEDEEAGALPSCKGVFKNWSAYVLTPVTSDGRLDGIIGTHGAVFGSAHHDSGFGVSGNDVRRNSTDDRE